MNKSAVCIDARMVDASGIGTYLRGLLSGIAELQASDLEITLLGDPARLPAGPWAVLPTKTRIYSVQEQAAIPALFRKSNAALLHSPHYNMSWALARKTVVTVHDLIHLKFPQFFSSLPQRTYAHLFFNRIVPKALRILTVSNHSKQDLVTHLGISADRVTVTYPAVSDLFHPLESSLTRQTLNRLQLPATFWLYVGNIKETKNVPFLVRCYRRFVSSHPDTPPLVIVGRNFMPSFESVLRNTPNIIWLNELDSQLLPALYAASYCFLFPSLYEGFGLPPLEAMACGTPVLVSNRASLPEVVGNAALLFEPEEEDSLISAMSRIHDDPELRTALAARGCERAREFSWVRMADQTLNVYRACLS